jgi:hypothetical protein
LRGTACDYRWQNALYHNAEGSANPVFGRDEGAKPREEVRRVQSLAALGVQEFNGTKLKARPSRLVHEMTAQRQP